MIFPPISFSEFTGIVFINNPVSLYKRSIIEPEPFPKVIKKAPIEPTIKPIAIQIAVKSAIFSLVITLFRHKQINEIVEITKITFRKNTVFLTSSSVLKIPIYSCSSDKNEF